jgi:hypothetical protein
VATRTDVKYMQSYLLLGAPVVFNEIRYNDPMVVKLSKMRQYLHSLTKCSNFVQITLTGA